MAILLHHIPAAVGFSAFMQHKKLEHSSIIKHLVAFTCTAPLSTIFFYFCLGMFMDKNIKALVGICLLISAGTFLYVSLVHILPETMKIKSKDINER